MSTSSKPRSASRAPTSAVNAARSPGIALCGKKSAGRLRPLRGVNIPAPAGPSKLERDCPTTAGKRLRGQPLTPEVRVVPVHAPVQGVDLVAGLAESVPFPWVPQHDGFHPRILERDVILLGLGD